MDWQPYTFHPFNFISHPTGLPLSCTITMSSSSPFRNPSVVIEPFSLGGRKDPVSWIDVKEKSDDALQYLDSKAYRFQGERRMSFQYGGTSWRQTFYGLYEGDSFVGWVPEGIMYIIASTGTEIRLIFEIQQLLEERGRIESEISRAWYAFRLRESLTSTIPQPNRSQSTTEIKPHSDCLGFVCWVARSAARLPHDITGREDFMSAFPEAKLSMYWTLTLDIGKSSTIPTTAFLYN